MPDISMCASEICPLRFTCYRNPESGTVPSEYWQSWFDLEAVGDGRSKLETDKCVHYWRKYD